MTASNPVICPTCGAEMYLRSTSKYPDKNGNPKRFWGCSKWPECQTCHGAHPDGSPLGFPGDQETRNARMEAHLVFDSLWRSRGWKRRGAYVWLSRKLELSFEDCHIAKFNVERCKRAIAECEAAHLRDLARARVPLEPQTAVIPASRDGPKVAHPE